MKKLALLVLLMFLPVSWLAATEIAITVHSLKGGSIGESVGVIVARDTPSGLVLEPYLNHLAQGRYEVTVHEHATCHGRYNADGSIVPGGSAGSAIASLPILELRDNQPTNTIISQDMQLRDIKNRSIMLSQLDETAVFDAISSKVACGALEN